MLIYRWPLIGLSSVVKLTSYKCSIRLIGIELGLTGRLGFRARLSDIVAMRAKVMGPMARTRPPINTTIAPT